jgi:hypothetical protein
MLHFNKPVNIARGTVNIFATLCSNPRATNVQIGSQTPIILPVGVLAMFPA